MPANQHRKPSVNTIPDLLDLLTSQKTLRDRTSAILETSTNEQSGITKRWI